MASSRAVETVMNYSEDGETPIGYWFYKPEGAHEKLRPAGQDRHTVRVQDAWPIADTASVDVEGFELHDFTSPFRDFDDEAAVEEHFYPQAVDFVQRHTGAKMVKVFDHTCRRRRRDHVAEQPTSQRSIPFAVHSDFTPRSGPQRVRDIMGNQAEALLSGRVAFFNVWKPLYEPVEELPLGLCDARSMADGDLMVMHLRYPDRNGEIYTLRHSPDHRWYYFPRMRPDQAILIKTYDNATDGRSCFNAHSAFADPDTPLNPRPRQSIEVRTMAFF